MENTKHNNHMDALVKELSEQLTQGKPLTGQDGVFTPLIKRVIEASLEGEMDGNTHHWWYTYNPLGQLKLVRSNTTTTTQVTDADYSAYWPAGMVQTEVLGNQTISFGYDERDRIIAINNVASSTPKFSAAYTYLANSNIEVAEFHQPFSPHSHKRYQHTFTYDNRNQLKSGNYQYWGGSSWQNSNAFDLTSMNYNKDGRIGGAVWHNGAEYVEFDYMYESGKNRLDMIVDWANQEIYEFGWDTTGNMISLEGLYGNTLYNITSTTYSWRNQPLSMSKSGSGTFTYRYDHMGHRVYKQEGDGIHYVRGAYGELLAVSRNGSIDHWNILRPDGVVIGRRDGGTGTRRYYHRDHLGSTRAVVTSGGSVTEVYDYMPFGDMMEDRITTSSGGAREKFTSHEFDDEVDLYYMQWRRYIPRFGVFTGVDPLANERPGLTPYNYVQNNPIIRVDPTGLLDDYALNRETGEITLIRTTDDDFDVLYATDDQGNVEKGKSIKVSKNESGGSILSDIAKGKNIVETEYFGTTYQGVVANTNNRGDARGVFGFAARNSNVEWSYQAYTDGSYSISTSFNANYTVWGSLHSDNFDKIVAHDIHNHPVSISSDRYPSGQDVLRARVLAIKNPSVKVWLYVPDNIGSSRIWDIRTMKRIN
jgi:RHS repeat-associated protein